MSILTRFTKELPEDPTLALITVGRRISQWFEEPEGPDDAETLTYLRALVRQFISRYSLRVDHPSEKTTNLEAVKFYVDQISRLEQRAKREIIDAEINEVLQDYEGRVRGSSFGIARLSADEKEMLHKHLGRIRKIIEESDLVIRKKNALYERISRLSEEIDREGTRTDQFFAFAGDLAFVLGGMTKKAKPLIDEVKDVLKIVGRSRAKLEGVSLPKGDESLMLPSPAPPPSSPSKASTS